MPKLFMTLGLPGSGKTTYARQQVAQSGGKAKLVCKDDLRAMLDAGVFSKKNEKLVLEARNNLLELYAKQGVDIYVADTNLNLKHEKFLRDWAKSHSYDFEVVSFLHIPLDTCVKQDLNRLVSVGERVIRNMHIDYVRPRLAKEFAETYYTDSELSKTKQNAIVVDVDGTVANHTSRSPYQFDKVLTDTPIQPVINVIRSMSQKIIFLSGRDSACYADTKLWLTKHVFYDRDGEFELFMRAHGDSRPDFVVKKELMIDWVLPRYWVDCIFDDRQQVVDMWRDCGFTVFQVNEGWF